MAFSRDGKTVMAGWQTNRPMGSTISLWETATGKPVGQAPAYRMQVGAVAFSPDAKIILTGSQQDHTARLWNAATGKPVGVPLPHQGVDEIPVGAFSPDGKTILTTEGSGVQFWDAATGRKIRRLGDDNGKDTAHALALALARDGKMLATVHDSIIIVRLWDTATVELLGQPLRHQEVVHAVTFSPDSSMLLTGCRDGTAWLWDTAMGRTLGPPMQHRGAVLAVAFSPDGKAVLTGSADMTARLWDRSTRRQIGPPMHHPDWVRAVAFSPDGKTVMSASGNFIGRLEVVVPVQGTLEQIALWTQVITSMELGDDGHVRSLDGPARQQRLRQLQELGGPPRSTSGS
jgi:WD40 repeat protein